VNYSNQNITTKAVGSLKWSALTEIAARTAQPIIFVVHARLLAPTDFGVLATAMIVISFVQMFWDAGLSKALIQTKEVPENAAHVVFWTNLTLGIIIYTLLFAAAPYIAFFFKSPVTEPVLRVLGIQIIIASLASVQQALFVRDLDFRGLFWIKLLTVFIPALFSIPLALLGYGIWSLVTGTLAGQFFNLLLLWMRSPWRPELKYDLKLAKKLMTFGIWILLGSLGSWLIMWVDNLIVGKFLGVYELGLYRIGWMSVTLIYGLVLNPIMVVLYPTISRMQDNLPMLKDMIYKMNKIIISIALPIGIGSLFIGKNAAVLLFGDKWLGLGFVFSILAFREAISWACGINSEVYKAIGKPDIIAKIEYALLLIIIPIYFFSVKFGLEIFLFARLGVTVIGLFVHMKIFQHILNLSRDYLWQHMKMAMLSCVSMAIVLCISKELCSIKRLPGIVELFMLSAIGICAYAATYWLLDRNFLIYAFKVVKRKAIA